MSPVVTSAKIPRHMASGGLTLGAARSLGSDGSDGDRKTAPGVKLFWASLLLLLLACSAPLASPDQPEEAPSAAPAAQLVGLVARVEHYAGLLREAAGELETVASQVSADGRLHSLQRLRDRQHDLQRRLRDVERAVEKLEAAMGELDRGG